MKREDLLKRIQDILAAEFDCDAAKVVPEARFYEDLDLDSIDAVDLVVRLRNEQAITISPAEFKAIRTVGDLLVLRERLTGGAER